MSDIEAKLKTLIIETLELEDIDLYLLAPHELEP